MNDRLRMVLTKNEIERIIIKSNVNVDEITVDLHKLTVKEAKRLIGNVMAIERGACKMKLIHGYNHGTAIKSMIMNDLNSPRIKNKIVTKKNPGLTTLDVAVA